MARHLRPPRSKRRSEHRHTVVPARCGPMASWTVNKRVPQGGQPRVRPIAIQEALVKIVESANIVELLSGIRPAIGPRQFGVGPSGTPHTATELIRAASERPNDHIYLSFDVANAVGFHRAPHQKREPPAESSAATPIPLMRHQTQDRGVLGRRSSGVAVAFVQPLLAPWLAPPPSTHRSQLATLPQTTRQRRSRPSRPSTSLDDDDITTQDPPHDVTLDWKTILDRAGWQSSVPSVSSGGPQAAPSTPRRTSHSISRQDASHLGRSITDDFTVTMGEPAGTPPHQKRADQAASLAQSIAELVNSGTDFSARHVTFVFCCSVALRVPWNSIFASALPPRLRPAPASSPPPFGRPSR